MRGCYLLLLFVLALSSGLAETDPAFREPDVLYFDQDYPEPLTAVLAQATPIYSGHDFALKLAVLPAQTVVTRIGQHAEGWQIQAKLGNRSFDGWIAPGALPALDAKILETVQANRARRESVAKAIAEKRVLRGMTLDEVVKALGKAESSSEREDQNGKIATWTYTVFEKVPRTSYLKDNTGRIYESVVYVKVPVGEQVIEFTNGVVTALEQHQRKGEAKKALIENAPIFVQ